MNKKLFIEFGAFFVVAAVTFLIYLSTLSPTINSFDSAEIITGAYSLGIIHAPGYPLFLMLGYLAAHLPFGDPAFNVNVLNAVFGSLAIGVIFLCCWKVSGDAASSAFCAFLAGFSNLYWNVSIVTEVHTFNALLIGIVTYRLLCFHEAASDRNLNLLVFAYGVSLAHHIGVILLFPFLFFFILRTKFFRFTFNNVLRVVLIFSLPFLVYLYFPLRSMANPPMDYVRDYFQRDLTSIQGIIWMMTGKMFSQEIFGKTLLEGFLNFTDLFITLWMNYLGIGILLAIYGLWALARDKFDLAVFSGGSSLLVLLFFANYAVVDNAQMIIPAIILMTIPMSAGLSSLRSKTFLNFEYITQIHFSIAGIILLLFLIFVNRPLVNRRGDWVSYNFANQVMQEVLPNSFIVSQWTAVTPLTYAQVVEGLRPDVEIFDRGLFVLGERDQIGENDTKIMRDLVSRITHEISKRPVYITENDYSLNDYFCVKPKGLIYRMYLMSADKRGCVTDAPE